MTLQLPFFPHRDSRSIDQLHALWKQGGTFFCRISCNARTIVAVLEIREWKFAALRWFLWWWWWCPWLSPLASQNSGAGSIRSWFPKNITKFVTHKSLNLRFILPSLLRALEKRHHHKSQSRLTCNGFWTWRGCTFEVKQKSWFLYKNWFPIYCLKDESKADPEVGRPSPQVGQEGI